MIVFERCTFKNFLSTGNQPTVIELNRVPSILITGQNGAGKSTLLDAITFGIYGKPYRNINKPQLVNTVNEKGLEVIVEFSKNGDSYKVLRGVKPTKFEIWRNGELLAHDAAAKDYQKRLEDILGLNYKAFCQIVILGSARYQSFMDISPNDRRTIIEEILDITVFTKMNNVLKTKTTNNELELREADYQKTIIENKIGEQEKNISRIIKRSNESDKKIEEEKARIDLQLMKVDEKIQKVDEKLSEMVDPDLNSLHDQMSTVKVQGHEIQQRKRAAEDRIVFYQMTNECETCKQDIPDHVKEEQIIIQQSELSQVEKQRQPLAEEYNSLQEQITEAEKLRKFIQAINTKRSELLTEKKGLKDLISTLESSKNKTDAEDLETARKELEESEAKRLKLNRQYIELTEEKHYLEICKHLLKDEGIKSKIIKQYLPLMNQLINKYLDRMGANYSFTLDEHFNEVIKSRYRDNFSYSSFSEGEKSRIDLALIFTWREIAKTKNSVNTNLLIMDEIGDSSMDGEGTDVLWEILSESNDSNIFVISHRTSNIEKFSSHIEIEKQGNFSKIKNSKY
ncbi:MAG: AAA family ATPase [Candidatus Thiodiazotropha taylori]|uniref:AAA family ATPase n=1 Tax=Candidatus Thiodiazotropha taylori TaxID=2792791 RepID=A0A9E4K8A4_9GAMM|nr:AAA family ATPase [Candidatus Thiodiazotropha taylori]MCW4255071.1 AAA family ATPase [Candidatus Thiodiazotropha taylori]